MQQGTPQRRGESSPGRGLLGGSSDTAARPLNGDTTALGRTGAAGTWGHPAGSRDVGQGAASGAVLQPFQIQFIKNMIDDSLEEFK